MRKIFSYTLYFFLTLFNSLVYSQVTFTVLDQETKEPINYIRINTNENISFYGDSTGKVLVDSSSSYAIKALDYKVVSITHFEAKSQNFQVYLTSEIIELDEVILKNEGLTSYRLGEGIIQKETISTDQIESKTASTTPELLEKSGFVFVQRSQLGGGSPVIRGFEANRILLLIDGIRLNNAIFRSGHLQTSLTINPASLDEIEILFGPSSLSYGSDALGGSLNFKTKNLPFSDSTKIAGSTKARYSSAEQEKTLLANFNIRKDSSTFDLSLRLTDFGDLRSGKNANFFNSYEWLHPEYVDQINGQDSLIQAKNEYIQHNSGYSQADIHLKHKKLLKNEKEQTITGQFSTSSNIARYDRLANYEYGLEDPDYARWDYGPQIRGLAYYKLVDYKTHKLYDYAEGSASFQYFQESRLTRRFKSSFLNKRVEHVYVPGVTFSAIKGLKNKGDLQYGIDTYLNFVQSNAETENILTSEKRPLSTRYPSNGSKMTTSGIFLNHKIQKGLFTFNTGIRLDFIHTDFKLDSAFSAIGIQKLTQNNTALSGGLGANYQPTENWMITANFQSGFRAPNIDDQSKVFDSQPGSVVIPNANLQTERSFSGELTSQFKLKALSVSTGINYSRILNLIAVDFSQLNGQDSIFYDGQLSRVNSNQNTGFGNLVGAFIKLDWQVSTTAQLIYTHTYTKGVLDTDEPMAHIPPGYGSLKYNQTVIKDKLSAQFSSHYNLTKKLKDFSQTSADRIEFATTTGTPAYLIFDFLLSYGINKWEINTGLKNILDTHYRVFASGINAPGRSFILSVSREF